MALTQDLAETIRGSLLAPADTEYEQARYGWNGMINRRPSLIAKCDGTADVITILDHARSRSLEVTVRGGGHSVAGRSIQDDAVLIDLSSMRSVQVDPKRKIARVGGGATWGTVDHETQAFGLAVTGGVDSRTGVGGLTLGGGMGYLGRPFGLTIDHLIAAEVVLYDGTTVRASDEDHPDLMWALRGGGGNLGVVTAFEFRLNEVGPEVMTIQVFHPIDGAAEAMRHYRDFMDQATDETAVLPLFVNVPPVDPFPADQQGKTALALVGLNTSSHDEAEEALQPLADHGVPMLAAIAPMPYTTLQSSFDAGAPDGGRYYWKAGYFDNLEDEMIDMVVERVDSLPGPYSNVFFEPMGGAIARVDSGATAFPHREAGFGFGISSGWEDPGNDEQAIAWTRSLFEDLEPYRRFGVYSNYRDRDEPERVDDAFAGNLSRLREIRSQYDPEGLFSAGSGEIATKG